MPNPAIQKQLGSFIFSTQLISVSVIVDPEVTLGTAARENNP